MTAAASSAYLELRNACVTRGGRPVLHEISLRLSPGEALFIEGPNGAGKSTLLRAAAGLCPLLSGTRRCTSALGWLGHQDGLKPGLSVTDNLRFTMRVHKKGPLDLERALASVGLTALSERPARLLSAGQKRRTALARLLLTEAPVWLLDEPATGLDAESLTRLGALMSRHLAAGGALAATSHVPLPLDATHTLSLTPLYAPGNEPPLSTDRLNVPEKDVSSSSHTAADQTLDGSADGLTDGPADDPVDGPIDDWEGWA